MSISVVEMVPDLLGYTGSKYKRLEYRVLETLSV